MNEGFYGQITVIEDDIDVNNLLRFILGHAFKGLEITSGSSFEEASNAILNSNNRVHGAKPGFLFLDLHYGDGEQNSILDILSHVNPDIPVLIQSADYVSLEEIERRIRVGQLTENIHTLRKPYGAHEVIAAVNQMIPNPWAK